MDRDGTRSPGRQDSDSSSAGEAVAAAASARDSAEAQGYALPDGELRLAPLDEAGDAAPSDGNGSALGAPEAGGARSPSVGAPPAWDALPPLELAHRPADHPPAGTRHAPSSGDGAAAPPESTLSFGASGGLAVAPAAQDAPPGEPAAAPAFPPPSRGGVEDEARRQRRRMMGLLAALGASIALAAVWYGFGLGDEAPRRGDASAADREELTADRGAGDGENAEALEAPAQEVRIAFEVTPRTAKLLVRGYVSPSHVLLVPYGEKPITVRFEAPGHVPKDVTVTPNEDRRVRVRLTPLPRPR